jgi:hypothetical protein
MLRSFHCAPNLDATHQATNPTGRSARPTAASCWPTLTALRMICDALREGLAAYRQYEHLRSRGVPHDTAVREALGIGLSPSQATRETAGALYFAGKA